MLTLKIPRQELFNEATMEFIQTPERTIKLCHSLVAMSKWEAEFEKPFLTKDERTKKEMMGYIRCMTITQNVPPETYQLLTAENLDAVREYIEAPMTATVLPKQSGGPNREVMTSELIYYWMVAFSIPFECQKWHINRLMTLINICSIKNQSSKPKSKADIMRRNRALNEKRKQSMATRG